MLTAPSGLYAECCALLLLYARMHIPVAAVALWMASFYALFSFLVVRVVCRDAVLSAPVGQHQPCLPMTYSLPEHCLTL